MSYVRDVQYAWEMISAQNSSHKDPEMRGRLVRRMSKLVLNEQLLCELRFFDHVLSCCLVTRASKHCDDNSGL